jgi:hypothetical protein
MHYVVDAWDWLNSMLAIPLVALLAGTTLTFAPFFLPRVRNAALQYSAVVFRWIVERLTAWQKRTYKVLGLARQEDLDELRRELRQAIKPTTAPAVDEAPAQRTITRAGTKIRLTDEIWRYLGKEDPRRVDSRMLDRLLLGPFCVKCSYLLAKWSAEAAGYYVSGNCPQCSHRWYNGTRPLTLAEFKKTAYQALDSEFLQTGILKDSR